MRGQFIIEQYPKATSMIKGFIVDRFKEGFGESESAIDRAFLDEVLNQVDDLLINMINNSPHSLFEMFDANSIYISIIVRHTKSGVLFNYRIVPRDKKNSSRSSNDRKIIEGYAIEDAFEMLENSL